MLGEQVYNDLLVWLFWFVNTTEETNYFPFAVFLNDDGSTVLSFGCFGLDNDNSLAAIFLFLFIFISLDLTSVLVKAEFLNRICLVVFIFIWISCNLHHASNQNLLGENFHIKEVSGDSFIPMDDFNLDYSEVSTKDSREWSIPFAVRWWVVTLEGVV